MTSSRQIIFSTSVRLTSRSRHAKKMDQNSRQSISSPENFGRLSLRREGVGVIDETWELGDVESHM